ncbi:hypothetical protein SAMN06295970_101147 [Noviherbaspirillum suwonense]|uniref:Uncharacterized protein n=1 Tax=Noviherbaspirillum suwonense TaxID=1224511 RepID=A0ABY1PRZ9_9BURK|nr:hypothetical protein SAMN06295970_101147 [Noviherbaspirillum suwonense]
MRKRLAQWWKIDEDALPAKQAVPSTGNYAVKALRVRAILCLFMAVKKQWLR